MAKYDPSLIAIEGDLAFSKSTVCVYVKLPATPYEFMDDAARERLAERIDIGLQGLVQNSQNSKEGHMIITSVPFDDESWAEDLNMRTSRQNPSPYWPSFFNQMQDHVKRSQFRNKEVFLGVNLGRRSEFSNETAFGFLRPVSDAISDMLGIKDYAISEAEIEFWKKKAVPIKRTLVNGVLNASPVQANTIARLVKETYWPSMQVPDVSASSSESWGPGELNSISVASIENHHKFLKIEQTSPDSRTLTGYRATLCFARFPDAIEFPEQEPWMHFASTLSAPTTIFSRFTIEPAGKVKKDVNHVLKTQLDQANNANGNISMASQEGIAAAQELEYKLTKDRRPLIYGRHRIVITAPTEEILRDRASEVIEHYKDIDIDVIWPYGDQMNLLLESQPADKVRVSAYYQRQELSIIPAGMPTGSGTVGDEIQYDPTTGKSSGWIGPYLGYTTSRVREPVFLSMHSAIARNKPPGLVITGAPGGGKSFSAFTLTYQMALQGIWTIFIDPKGDAIPLVDLPGLQGRVKKWDLRNDNEGLLDPFLLGKDVAEQTLLALETLKIFLNNQVSDKEDVELYRAVDVVSQYPRPSLYKVLEELKRSDETAAKSLSYRLNIIKNLPFAKLCFAETLGNREPISASDGLTIISLQDLDLPATTDRTNYTVKNYLAVGIMYLVTHYTEGLMMSKDKKHPKAVVIDEAWSITSTPQGANMIPRLTRMGRSLNTATVLVSQNAGDFLNLTNNMSYRMAFGTTDKDEIANVVEFFGLDPNVEGNAQTIAGLTNGECLMKDPSGNIARVKVDGWNERAVEKFDTNPVTRDKKVKRNR